MRVLGGMNFFSSILVAANVTFSIFVPPHAATDGVRFRVFASAGADVPSAMRACGIGDVAVVPGASADPVYQFAIPLAATADAQCLLSRLPAGSRLAPLDHWLTDARPD